MSKEEEGVFLNQTDMRILLKLVKAEKNRLKGDAYPPVEVDLDVNSLFEKLMDIAFMQEENSND